MKISSVVVVAALLLSGSLAFARQQASVGTVCLVPPRAAAGTVMAYPTGVYPMTAYSTTSAPVVIYPAATYPMVSAYPSGSYQIASACPPGMSATTSMYPMGYQYQASAFPMGSYPIASAYPMGTFPTTSSMYPMGYYYPSGTTTSMTNVSSASLSPDTVALLNSIAGLRSDVQSVRGSIQASALQMQGQSLVSRMNQLMADEMAFRQQLAANPNMPDAQIRATQLQNQANALNQDIAAFNTQLSMVPVSDRPYMAAQLNSFDVAYWQPAIQRFAAYSNQFPQSATTYQTAAATNTWLPAWQSSYQASLNNIAGTTTPQTFAQARWWTGTQVLGTTEFYPAGTVMMPQSSNLMVLPNGTIMAIPQSYVPMTSPMGTGTMGSAVAPAMGAGTSTGPASTY